VPAGVHSSHRSGLIESESRESVGVRGARVRAQKVASWTASRSECHSCAFHACCAATSRLLISTRWNDDWIYQDEFAPITDDNRDTIFGNEVQPKPTSRGMTTGAPPQPQHRPLRIPAIRRLPLRACRYVIMVTTAVPLSYL
jgi:hypothetical protein